MSYEIIINDNKKIVYEKRFEIEIEERYSEIYIRSIYGETYEECEENLENYMFNNLSDDYKYYEYYINDYMINEREEYNIDNNFIENISILNKEKQKEKDIIKEYNKLILKKKEEEDKINEYKLMNDKEIIINYKRFKDYCLRLNKMGYDNKKELKLLTIIKEIINKRGLKW